ncbi:MAG: PIN domain-containing protein [Candidatus Dormibacteraceae bacterium]
MVINAEAGLASPDRKVVFDANVLYPIALTDFFLTLASYGLYLPHWSQKILEEVEGNLLRNYPHITKEQLGFRFEQMERAYPNASVDPSTGLISAMTNDEKDRHVLAAAVKSQSSVIVTFNVRDFPSDSCQPYGVEAQHPDTFAKEWVMFEPQAVIITLRKMSGRTRHPHLEVEEIANRLRRDLPHAIQHLLPLLETD